MNLCKREFPQLYGLTPWKIPVKIEIMDSTDLVDGVVHCIAPHELFAAAWEAGFDAFSHHFLGRRGAAGPEVWWDRVSDDDWVLQHPALSQGTNMVVPTCWHMDGMEVFNSTEYYMWTYRSCLTSGDVWDVKMFMCAYPHWQVTQRHVREAVEEQILKFAAWSMGWCEKGQFPDIDFGGGGFPRLSQRQQRALLPLAGGYRMVYAGNCMDGKARKETNRFRHHASAECICEFCFAMYPGKTKLTPACLSFHDFGADAPHRSTRITHDMYVSWMDDNLVRRTPWAQFTGWHLETTLLDWMHVLHLGTARDVCGSALCTMIDDGVFGRGSSDAALGMFAIEFRAWMHRQGKRRPRCLFTMKSLRKSRQAFPEIPARIKAMTIKYMIRFLAEKSVLGSCRLRTGMLAHLDRCHVMMGACNDTHFLPHEAHEFVTSLRLHLRLYQRLNEKAVAKGICEWHFRPKGHMLDEIATFVEKTHRNPLFFSCFLCEDFIGKHKKPGQKCNGRSVGLRVVEKYLVGVVMRWAKKRDAR
jgi:hypothetical protein